MTWIIQLRNKDCNLPPIEHYNSLPLKLYHKEEF